MNRFFRVYQVIVGTIFTLPILAPIFMILKIEFLAKPIYFLYSYTCHQLHWRSLHIGNYQVAWCARDTFIWGGMFLSTIIMRRFKVRLSWKTLPIFLIPIALDGGIQTIGTFFGLAVCPHCQYESGYTSTNLMRAGTGAWFGLGLGMFLSTLILELEEQDIKINFDLKKVAVASGVGMSILAVFYVAFVGLWSITSTTYKPSNFLDYTVKTPANIEERWVRQLHGGCNPETPKNIMEGTGVNDFTFLPGDCF